MGAYVDELSLLAAVMRTRGNDQAEEARAFGASVEPHLTTMLRLARRLGRQNAEDIVQDALARAWSRRGDFNPNRGSLGAWLLAITADQAYKTWRWIFRHNRPIEPVMEVDATSDELVDLERAIHRLPARQRLAVDCFYFAGLSVAETVAVMRCSEGNVKSTLSAARTALRELLR